jgi:uncharacterized damage-inducible protein DinB
MQNNRIQFYANRFREIYEGTPWYGDTISSKLIDVDPGKAFVRPREDVHALGEVVAHMIYWRKSLISRLKKDTAFIASGDSPDNWPALSRLTEEGWSGLLASFQQSQQELQELLARQSDELLSEEYADGSTYEYLIQGVIDHDLYHLGQIGLIRKMSE